MITVAINGLGRIGKNIIRILCDPVVKKKIRIKAINIGPDAKELVTHSIMYDTLMGTYHGHTVLLEGDTLIIDDQRITIYAQTDPTTLSWSGIDWVVDASGKFTKKVDAQKHIDAGARGVIITAPSPDADQVIVMGVNDHAYRVEKNPIVSIGSCTTNAVTPLLALLDDCAGITQATLTTVHSYTNNQALLDVDRGDARRSRAAALNIIPTTTGAMDVVEKVLPQLKTKLMGCSLRVPVAKVSLVDLGCILKKAITVEQFHAAAGKAMKGPMKGIVSMSAERLVSSDFAGDSHSVIIDTSMTMVHDNLIKIFGWYDNEWGYSCRIRDFLLSCGS